jgi:hypothetical protein
MYMQNSFKAFNPNQPRDSHGRFGEVAASAASALSSVVGASGNAAHVAATMSKLLKGGMQSYLASFREITPLTHTTTKAWADEALSLLKRSLGGVGLSDAERLNIKDYTSSHTINDELRGLKSGRIEELDKVTQYAVHHLDSAIQKAKLPENLVLWRGFDNSDLPDLKPGNILSGSGYLSTSLSKRVAVNFTGPGGDALIRINARKGSHALVTAPLSEFPNESELLLPRNSRIRIYGEEIQRPDANDNEYGNNIYHAELL